MPRSKPQYFGEFLGLDLNSSQYAISPAAAWVADNVIVQSGQVETRPGRLELSEDQLAPTGATGLFNYTPPGGTKRSIIIVRPDGIYQRVG